MVQVQTVRGAVAADALGMVLIHEHVFVRSPDVLTNYPALWNEEERVADARLRALKERGDDHHGPLRRHANHPRGAWIHR